MTANRKMPSLDDYRAMMRATHSPAHLKHDVLKQAAYLRHEHDLERASACDVPSVGGTKHEPHSSPTSQTAASSRNLHATNTVHPRRKPRVAASQTAEAAHALPKRYPEQPSDHADAPAFSPKQLRFRGFAVAACLALTVGLALTGATFGWSVPQLGNGSEKTVSLSLGDSFGGGGYSGAWYNPADGTCCAADEWAGYKYGFNLTCTGQNIESITYELEGDRTYFETIDTQEFKRPPSDDGEDHHAFDYMKSLTFDYDNQKSDHDTLIISIYVGFPLTEEATQTLHAMYLEDIPEKQTKLEKQLDTAIETGAAQEISTSRLKLTTTFTDGTSQTKNYIITPVDDFEQRYSTYWDTRQEYSALVEREQQKGDVFDPSILPETPSYPELYTITEIPTP